MDAASIEQLIHEVRTGLGYNRGVRPRILAVFEAPDSSLHIVTSDRAEKSLCLGPDGRVAAELAKRLVRRVTFYGEEELLIRRHRLALTLSRIEEIDSQTTESQRTFLQALASEIRMEMCRPAASPSHNRVPHSTRVAVAYSGGYDSTAAAVMLKEMGFSVTAFTVDLGDAFIPRTDRQRIIGLCTTLGIDHVFIRPESVFEDITQRARSGRIHPCGQCHSAILDHFIDSVQRSGLDIAVTGEMSPTGRQAIVLERGILLVHLPAALAISKHRTMEICNAIGLTERLTFGCGLLREVHCRGWSTIGPSIYRVLRELDADVLTTGQALEYVRSIIRPFCHQDTHRETDCSMQESMGSNHT